MTLQEWARLNREELTDPDTVNITVARQFLVQASPEELAAAGPEQPNYDRDFERYRNDGQSAEEAALHAMLNRAMWFYTALHKAMTEPNDDVPNDPIDEGTMALANALIAAMNAWFKQATVSADVPMAIQLLGDAVDHALAEIEEAKRMTVQ